jgi:hypothetical protein
MRRHRNQGRRSQVVYNANFTMSVVGVEPYLDKNGSRGILLKGVHLAEDVHFLDDLGVPEDRKDGLNLLIAGSIPTKGWVPLLFSVREVE